MKNTSDIIEYCQELYEDIDFTATRKWKEADPSRKVVGYMPVYAPRELMHAGGILSLGQIRCSIRGRHRQNHFRTGQGNLIDGKTIFGHDLENLGRRVSGSQAPVSRGCA